MLITGGAVGVTVEVAVDEGVVVGCGVEAVVGGGVVVVVCSGVEDCVGVVGLG